MNKKPNTLYTASLALCTLFAVLSGCTAYLDVKPDRSLAIPHTLRDLQAILDNETRRNASYPFSGDVGSDYYYLSDADFSALNEQARSLYRWHPQALAEQDWQSAYTKIFDVNVVLEAVDDADRGSLAESARGHIKGTALFFRGWLFFQLAQLFAPPYDPAIAANLPGIPVRLTANIEAPTTRASLAETYGQVIEDLEGAASLLPTATAVATRPAKAAAHAALARVYLAMSDYLRSLQQAEASLALHDALMDFNDLSTSANKPISVLNSEVLVHMQLPNGGGGFANTRAKVNPELHASYLEGDLRREVFFRRNTDGSYRFTGDYGTSTTATTPFCGLATDEVYLTKAECLARLGDAPAAMETLNALLKTRWEADRFTPYAIDDPDEALDLVVSERYKELAFRGGIRWGDLKRLNKEPRFAKVLTRVIDGATYELPPNDLRYTLLIPHSVIDQTGIEQNSR